MAFDDPLLSRQWHIVGKHGINVLPAWNKYRGSGVVVGVVDTGIQYTHPDLKDRYDTTRDYDIAGGDEDSFASSGDVHGNQVAQILAATAGNGVGLAGVAPEITLVGFRIPSRADRTPAQEAKALALQTAVDVSNNSWSYSGKFFYDDFGSAAFQPVAAAIIKVAEEGRDGLGTVIVRAAGNSRSNGDNVNYHNHQNDRCTITVAATQDTGKYAPYSTPGAAILVSAPGRAILTTGFASPPTGQEADYATADGTSYAAPMVSGTAALMLEANPDLGYRDVHRILAMTARQTDLASTGWKTNGSDLWNGGGLHVSHDYGYGLVDASAAVRLARSWTEQSTAANERLASASSATPQAIPDAGAPLVLTADLAAGVLVERATLHLDINHARPSDLQVALVSPAGTRSVLVDGPPRAQAGGIDFDFSSTHFLGEESGGRWSIEVRDRVAGTVGSVQDWRLDVYGSADTANDVYVFTDEFGRLGTTAGRDGIDDAAGSDSINAAACTGPVTLDLAPGAGGTVAGRKVALGASTVIEAAEGGAGADRLTGNGAANRLRGWDGDDVLDGRDGADVLDGGDGADVLAGGAGPDVFVLRKGEAGGDWIKDFETGVDTVSYEGYADLSVTRNGEIWTLSHSAGKEAVRVTATTAEPPPADVTGTDGADALRGTATGEHIAGLAGDDSIAGYGGADLLDGGPGNDRLMGGAGNDRLRGGMGDDRLAGDIGSDSMSGGDGRDAFILRKGETAGDVVLDFESGLDKLELRGFGSGATLANAGADSWSVSHSGGTEVFKIAGLTGLASGDYAFI